MIRLSGRSTLRQSSGVLAQQVKPDAPSLVLLNPRSGKYYTLEDVGTRIWQLCDGTRSISQIAVIMGEEYDESPDIIESDVMELVKELIDEELVVDAG